jgi:hypothetical protein
LFLLPANIPWSWDLWEWDSCLVEALRTFPDVSHALQSESPKEDFDVPFLLRYLFPCLGIGFVLTTGGCVLREKGAEGGAQAQALLEKAAAIDAKQCTQWVALHEFGHVAGLRHEHVRPEALDDKSCKAKKLYKDVPK